MRPTLLIRARRQRDVHREHGLADPRRLGRGVRRRAGVPRRQREPRAEPHALATTRATTSSRASSTAASSRARLERALQERQGARDLLRAAATSTSTSSRSSTTPAATAPATRCSGRSARCSRPRSAGATRSRASAATSSACCSRAARSRKRCAWPSSCARPSATSSSSGRSARSGSACSVGVVPITRRQRGRRVAAVGRRQRLRGGQGSGPQPRLQLPGERHRPDAPPARDAVGRAHQQRARGVALRAVPHDDPAAADGGAGRALRAAAAHEDEAGKIVSPGQLHRRGRALRPHAGDRPLGDRERAALAGVGGRRARAARAVLDQPVRPEPGRRQVPAVRDRPVPPAAASTPRRSASRSRRPRRSRASRRRTASSRR